MSPTTSISKPRLTALAAVTLLLLLPFIAKPLHVDDPLFVWTAKQIIAHPLDPWNFPVNWSGQPQLIADEMENPPLVPYFLAVVGRVGGWGEVTLHAAMLPVGVLTVIGTALLAGRFCRHPIAAALLLVVAPGYWISATSLMADGPLLCLWIWAVYLWVRGSDAGAGNIRFLMAATVVMVLAVLVKYPAINLIPLLAAHAVLCPTPSKKSRLFQAIALIAPVAALVAYDRLSAVRYGHGLVWHAIAFSRSATQDNPLPWAGRGIDALAFVAGTALPAALLGIAVLVRRGWAWRAGLAVAPVMFGLYVAHVYAAPLAWSQPGGPSSAAYFAQFGLLAMAGLAMLVAAVIGADRERPGLFLLLWVAGVLVFASALNWSTNVRTMLPMLPAVSILAVRAAEHARLRMPRMTGAAVGLGGAISLLVVLADFRYARDNRDGADQLARMWATNGTPASRVWFGGHWGFQYYMQLAGARPLDGVHGGCRPGDLVLLALDNYGTPRVDAPLERGQTLFVGAAGSVTTTNMTLGANFYASPGNRIPFAFGPVPPEAYEVDRVGDGPR